MTLQAMHFVVDERIWAKARPQVLVHWTAVKRVADGVVAADRTADRLRKPVRAAGVADPSYAAGRNRRVPSRSPGGKSSGTGRSGSAPYKMNSSRFHQPSERRQRPIAERSLRT